MFLERDRDRAKDLVCDAVYGALRAWKKIGTPEALRAYCITAILRAHRNSTRSNDRFVRGTLDELVAPSHLSPEELTDVQIVRDAIAALVQQTAAIEQAAGALGIRELNPDTADHSF